MIFHRNRLINVKEIISKLYLLIYFRIYNLVVEKVIFLSYTQLQQPSRMEKWNFSVRDNRINVSYINVIPDNSITSEEL